MNKRVKLLIIGPFPPPIGGVSIHLDRLYNYLTDFFEIRVIDESKIKKKKMFNLYSPKCD